MIQFRLVGCESAEAAAEWTGCERGTSVERTEPIDVDRMAVAITLGVPKDRYVAEGDTEASEQWDRLTEQIADIKASGHQVEIPR